jgi:hypothetical protein
MSFLMTSPVRPYSPTGGPLTAKTAPASRTSRSASQPPRTGPAVVVNADASLAGVSRAAANETAVWRQCIRSSFGEPGALFSTRAGTSSAEGGCPDLDPFRGSGCGAKLICNRLARLAKKVHFLAPLIAAVRCHSPSSRTRQVHLQLERGSPAAQPTSSRHKRSRSSSIGSLKPAERDTRADVRSKALRRVRRESTKLDRVSRFSRQFVRSLTESGNHWCGPSALWPVSLLMTRQCYIGRPRETAATLPRAGLPPPPRRASRLATGTHSPAARHRRSIASARARSADVARRKRIRDGLPKRIRAVEFWPRMQNAPRPALSSAA